MDIHLHLPSVSSSLSPPLYLPGSVLLKMCLVPQVVFLSGMIGTRFRFVCVDWVYVSLSLSFSLSSNAML